MPADFRFGDLQSGLDLRQCQAENRQVVAVDQVGRAKHTDQLPLSRRQDGRLANERQQS